MENNHEMIRNKNRKVLSLCISLLAVIIVIGLAGIIVLRKTSSKPATGNNNFSNAEEQTVSDVTALRELLLQDGECSIVLTEDISISESLVVKGTKRLSGNKTITMQLDSEYGQAVCSVKENASLIIDGVTLDGNGLANGVDVVKKGSFTFVSGEIYMAMPYGIVTAGNVKIEDGIIKGTLHTGVLVETDGELYMEGGKILDTVHTGLAVSPDAYAKIDAPAAIQESDHVLVFNRGTVEFAGGVLSDSYWNAITNNGELNIDCQEGEGNSVLEIYNVGLNAISSGSATVNVNGVYIHDVAEIGMKFQQAATGTVTNCKIEKTGTMAVYVESAELKMTDAEIIESGTAGVFASAESKIILTNMDITNAGWHGVANWGGHVTTKNIRITTPTSSGICTKNDAVTELEDTVITESKNYGVQVVSGNMTVKNMDVIGAEAGGFSISKDASATVTELTIDQSGFAGMYVAGALNATGVKITDCTQHGMNVIGGKVDVNNLNIIGSTGHGINNAGGNVTVEKGKIASAKKSALNLTADGKIVVRDVEMTENGEKFNVVHVAVGSTATLEKVTITKPGLAGIYVAGALEAKDVQIDGAPLHGINNIAGTVKAEQITITNTTGHGINNVGGNVTVENGKITSVNKSAFNLTADGKTVIKDVEIAENGEKFNAVHVAVGSTATLEKVTITKPGLAGIYVAGALEAKDVQIDGAPLHGINNIAGTVKAEQITITNTTGHGINNASGNVTVENGKITSVNKSAFNLTADGKTVIKNVEIAENGEGFNAVHVAEGSTATLRKVTITKPGLTGIYVAGTIDAKDVQIDGAPLHGINNIAGTVMAKKIIITDTVRHGINNAGGTIEASGVTITQPKGNALNLSLESTTDITELKVENATENAVNVVGESVATVDNCQIDTTGGYAVIVDASKVDLTNVNIKNSGKTAVYTVGASETEIYGGSITNSGNYGVQATGGSVTAKNLEIENTTYDGIHVSEGVTVFAENSTIKGTGNAGIYMKGSVTATNITIQNTTGHGINNIGGVVEDGSTGINITNTTGHGINNAGGTIKASVVTVTQPKENSSEKNALNLSSASTTVITNLKVENAIKNGVNATGESNVTVNGCQIDTTGEYAVNVDASTAKLTSVNIANTGKSSVYTAGASETEMDGGSITNAGKHGLEATGGTVMVKNLTIDGTKVDGIHVNTDIHVIVSSSTIKNTKSAGIYINGSVTATNITIQDTTGHGINNIGGVVEEGSTGITITNTNHGINNSGGTVKASVVTIKQPRGKGLNLSGASTTEIATLIVENVVANAVALSGTATMNATDMKLYRGSKTNGVLVDIGAGTTLTINGDSIISGNNYDGRGVQVAGTFIMNDGSIQNNTYGDNVGAGVYVDKTGVFTMNEGCIQNNTAGTQGGGIYVSDSRTFIMNGGTIYKNTATAGGGIYIGKNCTFTMNAGTIRENTATTGGGAGVVLDANSSFTMNGGKIIYNAAHQHAGALYASGNNEINLNAGEIQGNTVTLKPWNKDTQSVGIVLSSIENYATSFTMSSDFYMGEDHIRITNVTGTPNKPAPIIRITGSTWSKHSADNKLFVLPDGTSNFWKTRIIITCDSEASAAELVKSITSGIDAVTYYQDGIYIKAK